ncbi:MAG: TetR family transcriptional regulator C-terminal domain-containing protein [Desulfobacteraceae bacterium]|nr:TetR family transcriptional regulator C-terminal domain-containing protein [Desulfobacteraceae bacterium]
MKQDTKQKIIETGAHIIHHKGYNHTGIQEILNAAEVPKGSFYFYFNNKEDFGLHVIDYFNNMFKEMLEPVANNKSLPPVQRLESLFDLFIELFKTMDYTRGCPIGNLSQEMGDLNPAFSAKLTESVELMVQMYKSILDEAKNNGDINEYINTKETADFIVSSWHGSLIRMKLEKGVESLELHKRFILNILQHPTA